MLTLSICPLYFPGLQAISHSARLRRLPWGYSQAQHVFFSLPFPVVTVLPCPSHPSAQLDKSVSLQSDLALPPFPPAHYLPAFTMTQQKCISPEKLCLTHTCPWIFLRTHFPSWVEVFQQACNVHVAFTHKIAEWAYNPLYFLGSMEKMGIWQWYLDCLQDISASLKNYWAWELAVNLNNT